MNQRFCNGMIHVIRSGDNLYQLSRRYRVPLALILRANPYVDVYNLRPGQEICIPMPCGSGPIAGRGMQQENVEIHRVAVYSKEKLALNTLSDDGRLGTLSDMAYADRKDYYTEFCVRFISE